MSASFLAAVQARRLDACPITPTADADVSDYLFDLDDGDEENWCDVWINCFAAYGDQYATALPPPPTQDSWFPCDHGGNRQRTDDALRALEEEDVERVRELFAAPNDLLRWRSGTFRCGNVVGFTFHLSAVHLAFCSLNLSILQHFFAVSPMRFMQLMGMSNTEEHMGEGGTLPLLYALSLPFPLTGAAVDRRASRLPDVMAWLCESGLMTPNLAAACFPMAELTGNLTPKWPRQETEDRWVIEAAFAREHLSDQGKSTALDVLERWERLTVKQQRQLSEATFAPSLFPFVRRLPWQQERVLWLGMRHAHTRIQWHTPRWKSGGSTAPPASALVGASLDPPPQRRHRSGTGARRRE